MCLLPRTMSNQSRNSATLPICRIRLFVSQVAPELRAVRWSGRSALLGYTSTVLVFCAVTVALVTPFDAGVSTAVLRLLG
jgi:preprotein translocase SecE subunit